MFRAVSQWPAAALLSVSAVVVVLDQASKLWAHATLRGKPTITVIPGCFEFIYSRNDGGLFGFFGDWHGGVRTLLLLALPLVAVGMITWLIVRSSEEDGRSRLGLALILGGAIGNLIDRILRGEVIDFIDWYVPAGPVADWLIRRFGTAHWPTFNIADSSIVAGACLLLLAMALPARLPDERPAAG